MTGRGWLACAGPPMMVGILLAACAERQGAEAGGEVTDCHGQRSVDGGSAPAGIHDTQCMDTSARGIGDDDARTLTGARSAEGESSIVVREGTGEAGAGERALEVSPFLSAGVGAGAQKPTTPAPVQAEPPSDEPETKATPVAPVSAIEGEVLPVAQPVTGADVKLDGVLLELVRALRGGGAAGVLAYVERYQLGLSVDSLRVQIVCESGDVAAAVREQVVEAGGTVTTSFANYVWAEVPLDQVEALAAAEAVWTIGVSQAIVQPGSR